MIIYDSRELGGYAVLFHTTGSALPREFLRALLGGLLTLVFYTVDDDLRTIIRHPAAYFTGMTTVLGFLIVYRSNLAYARYWEGRTMISILMSKLEDIAMHCRTYVQGEDEPCRAWKKEMARLILLFHALVMHRLRGEMDLSTLEKEGIMTKDERVLLENEPNRPVMAFSWLTNTFVKRTLNPGMDVHPPVIARTFAVMTDVMTGYNNARKLRETPFPFPYVQLVQLLLNAFLFTVPVVIAAFIPNRIFGPVICFLVVWTFFAINSTAAKLENPFGRHANDLPLDYYYDELKNDLYAIGLLKDEDGFGEAALVDEMTRSKSMEIRGVAPRPSFDTKFNLVQEQKGDDPNVDAELRAQVAESATLADRHRASLEIRKRESVHLRMPILNISNIRNQGSFFVIR